MNSPSPTDIRAVRTAAGWTQAQAAERIYSTRRTFQDWERGVSSMPAGLFELLCIKAAQHLAAQQMQKSPPE